jgi:hypothetical protein
MTPLSRGSHRFEYPFFQRQEIIQCHESGAIAVPATRRSSVQ